MAKVAIVMGSDSDMPVMAQAADVLEKLGVDFEITVISAHREPDIFFEYAKTAEARCRPAYRLPRLRLMEERTREFSRRRSLLRLMKRCSAN